VYQYRQQVSVAFKHHSPYGETEANGSTVYSSEWTALYKYSVECRIRKNQTSIPTTSKAVTAPVMIPAMVPPEREVLA